MAKPKKKSAPKRKPFTLSIHGEWLDIDAEIRSSDDLEKFVDVFAQKIFARQKTAQTPEPTISPNFASDALGEIIGMITDDDLDKMRAMIDAEQAKRVAEHPSH